MEVTKTKQQKCAQKQVHNLNLHWYGLNAGFQCVAGLGLGLG